MKKRILSIILTALMVFSIVSCANNEKTDDTVQSQTQEKAETKIKNVILLIPDGGGYANFDFANYVKKKGGFTNEEFTGRTPVEKSPMFMRDYLGGSAVTLNVYGEITDSAAAGTAIATGQKTVNGYIGVNGDQKPVATTLEAAQSLGKSTGIISTYEWMHATPASFTAHAENRSDYATLYKQIENQGVDVVLGSGYGGVKGHATIDNAVNNGYKVVNNKQELKEVKPGDKIWGNITDTSSPYDIRLSSTEATLSEMTSAAITALSADEDGFFLMVEGSKVDSGGHANDAVITTSEYLAFDEAFRVAVEFAKTRDDTVVIAIPDHDTGAMEYDEIDNIAVAVKYVQKGENTSRVTWGTTGHSEQNVGVWIYAPEGVDIIPGLNTQLGDSETTRSDFVIDNTNIAPYIASLWGVDLQELSKELFVDVTDMGTYDEETGRFTFDDTKRYVEQNQDHYYKDGQKVELDGKIAFHLFDRFYVPKEVLTQEEFDELSSADSSDEEGSSQPDASYKITAVVATPEKTAVKKGESITISAVVEGENNPPQDVSYYIEGSDVSDDTYIDENGKLTIGAEETCSSVKVAVKSAIDGSVIDIVEIEVE